jgi:DNA-binding protein YbaB
MFSQMKDLYKLQKEAKKMEKELKKIQIEAEVDGVTVVMDGKQEVVSVTIDESVPRERIGDLVKEATNKASKKAQVVAAERMQGVMGQMGLGGMMGQGGGMPGA